MSSAAKLPHVLVVGVGALGAVVAFELRLAGHDVSVLTHDSEVARVLRVSGLREARSGRLLHLPVIEQKPEPGRTFDYVLLATQPPEVEQVAIALGPHLGSAGRLVCLQNGLCEERAARHVPRSRVIGGVVAFGASAHGPGLCERTSYGGIALGNLDGAYDESLERLARILTVLGPVRLTTNLAGIRWSKLAVNCAISTLGTIGGDRLGVLMQKSSARTLAFEIMDECVRVAKAAGVKLERLPGVVPVEWLSELRSRSGAGQALRSLVTHSLALAMGFSHRQLRSSMLRALERGRPPAVDYLNGEVVDRGQLLGIPTPVNAEATRMVWRLARGELLPSPAALEELYRMTRQKGVVA